MNAKSELRPARSTIEAIWFLLATGNVHYRAAAILLLQEYCKTLVASGKGNQASELLQIFRDEDPKRDKRPKGKEHLLCP